MKQKLWKILGGLVCTTALANAETTPDALVAQALQQNPELNFYVANIGAAKGGLRTAGTTRNPELSTQAGYKNSRDNSGGPSGDGAAWSVSFSQTFEYPGRIALRRAIANHDVDLAELHLAEFRRTLAARVRTLAYSVASAEKKSAVAREIGSRFKVLSDVIAQRPAAGVTPQLEARIIDANALAFQRQERDAALEATTIVAELNQLCGQPANVPLRVRAGAVRFSRVSLPDLLKAARVKAYDIRIRQVELSAARIQSRAVEKRTLSGNCGRAVLFAGECGGQGTASRSGDRTAGAIFGTATPETSQRARRVSNKRKLLWRRHNAKWNGASLKALQRCR